MRNFCFVRDFATVSAPVPTLSGHSPPSTQMPLFERYGRMPGGLNEMHRVDEAA